MPKPAKILLTNLREQVHPADVFVCCASFETRSQSVPAQLEGVPFTRALICANENFPRVIRQGAKQLQHRFGRIARLVHLNTDNPLRTADSLQERRVIARKVGQEDETSPQEI